MIDSMVLASKRNVQSRIRFASAILLAILGNLLVVGSPLFADQPNKQARQKVNEGLQQYSSGNYEQAAKSFAEAAQAAPDNPIIKFDEACAVSAAGDDDKARELLLQASASSDPQVSAAACYNLAAIAAKRGRKELGDDPISVAPEARQAALDRLKAAATHYRDCLRIAPEHPDARHNLELVLTLVNYLQQQWQLRDHQQAMEKMSLFDLLRHLDDQQLNLRSSAIPYKGKSASKVSRFDRAKLSAQQMKLLEDMPTLKSKIDAQLSNSANESTPQTNAPGGANGPGGANQQEPSEVEAQLRKLVAEQQDQAGQAIRQASEDLRAANWDRALERQRSTSECFRQLQALFSAFPENLDLAIELQESLIAQDGSSNSVDSTSNSSKSNSRDLSIPSTKVTSAQDSSADGQAWQQGWVTNFSQSLAAKANATLQSLPVDNSNPKIEPEPSNELPDSADKNESNDSESLEADKPESEKLESEKPESERLDADRPAVEQAGEKTPELGASEESELTPEQKQLKQQEEFTKQLRKALERTVELAPAILERSADARGLLSESQNDAARPAQDDVLHMLKEIRDLLPKQPNQDQEQNQNQNQDKNQKQNQNKDQKNSDQKEQNDQKDSKSKDQQENQENQENGEEKKSDKQQDADNSSTKDEQKNKDSKDPKESDKSQQEKKNDPEKSEPKDASKEAEEKAAEEKSKEQAAKEAEKTNAANKSAEQTAQQIAEQRAQAVLRRIREREAKYRELLQQLRERQAQQVPVEKDW